MTHMGKGLQQHRLKNNPEEKKFATAWEKQNVSGKVLAHILDACSVHQGMPPEPSDRDYEVAATVVQWLGSPVGQSWLNDLGYRKEHKTVGRKHTMDGSVCADPSCARKHLNKVEA